MHAAVLTRFAAGALIAGLMLAAPALAAEPVFPIGSRIGLAPPGKMARSTAFRGFEDRDAEAKMIVLDMPAPAYADVERELAPATVQKQGLIEETREPVTFATGTGLLIVGRQEAEGRTWRKWIFLASLQNLAALIAVQVPEDAKAAYPDAAIRAALTSLATRPDVPIDEQLRLVPIRLDDLSGLRAFRVIPPNTVFLTEGPKDTLEATEQPILAISIGPGGPESTADRDNFARNLLGGMSEYKDARIVSRDMLKLGSIPTHEIQAEAVDAKSNVPVKLVQWVQFGHGAFIRLVGVARADLWRDVFPRFRAVREGIRSPQ